MELDKEAQIYPGRDMLLTGDYAGPGSLSGPDSASPGAALTLTKY